MSDEHLERERKFDVPDGWQMPSLAQLLPEGGSLTHEVVRLRSTYYDTPHLDLLRARLTLRRRTGDADLGWHLKVPSGTARLEIRAPLDTPLHDALDAPLHDALDEKADVPAELLAATLGVRAGAPLAPVATVDTERSLYRLIDDRERVLAEVALDDVHGTARGAAAVVTRWREVEVELGEAGGDELLDRAAALLSDAGARPGQSPSKVARALGHSFAAYRPSGLAGTVHDYLNAQYTVLIGNDLALRRGRDVVHGTRTASRRYRSALRVFADIADGERASRLDGELRWYAEALGGLRDRQVLREHLDAALDSLPPELVLGPVRDRIRHLLAAELAEATTALETVMASERYFALLQELRDWHEHPPLSTEHPGAAAARYLRRTRRTTSKRLRAARHEGTRPEDTRRDAAMHRARKAAKRWRYTAELVEGELGKRARKDRKKAKRHQQRLGARQDSVIAADFLLRAGRLAGTTTGENGFTFGLLYQRERDAADMADKTA